MTDSLVQSLLALPPNPGITYRGMSSPAPNNAITIPAVLPTSVDPRIASENFTSELVVAILSASARLIAPFSAHPSEQELAILPGRVLIPVGSVAVPGLENNVVLLVEAGGALETPRDHDEFVRTVFEQVKAAYERGVEPIHSPGRFSPRLTTY